MLQMLFDFQDGKSKRVARPTNRRVEAQQEMAELEETAISARALIKHTQKMLAAEARSAHTFSKAVDTPLDLSGALTSRKPLYCCAEASWLDARDTHTMPALVS